MADPEVTLRTFVESSWFKMLARGAMIVAVPALGYVGWVLTDVRVQQVTTASDLVEVQSLQSARASDGESFQSEVRNEISDIQEHLDRLENTTTTVREDVATIKGILLREDAVATRGLVVMPR